MKWRTAEIFQRAGDTIWTHLLRKRHLFISIRKWRTATEFKNWKVEPLPPFSRRLAFATRLAFIMGICHQPPQNIYIIDLCFNLHLLLLFYPQLFFQGSLLQRRQATLKQILYSNHDRRDSVNRFLVFKPPLTRRYLHHFYPFPYPHLLQPFLVSAQRDPWSLVLCHFRFLAHTSHPPSPSM